MNRRDFIRASSLGALGLQFTGALCGSGALCGCGSRSSSAYSISQPKRIQAFCVDYNWHKGKFAAPGQWAEVDPVASYSWHKALGCNAIVTFAVSCNGYAWYRNSFAPQQPGLKHDFLSEMVRLGHKDGVKVFGYFCFGANSLWGEQRPDESYGTPTAPHIPLTKKYNDYLCSSIANAMKVTGIDGIRIDWMWNPKEDRWLPCERQMYKELMGETFPDTENISSDTIHLYRKRALNRLWEQMYATVKSFGKDKIVWHSINRLAHPDIADDDVLMLQQPDWLTNEAGDLASLRKVKERVGKQTRLVTCMASWNGQDVVEVVNEIQKSGFDVGLYGFTPPVTTLPPPIADYLKKPVSDFKGDARNIAVYARIFNGRPID
jgi:hypothetical protein